MSITSSLFRAARLSATLRAIGRGPVALLKRLIRIIIGRTFGPWLYRWPK